MCVQHGVLTVREVSVFSLGNVTCLHGKKFEFGLGVKTENDKDALCCKNVGKSIRFHT